MYDGAAFGIVRADVAFVWRKRGDAFGPCADCLLVGHLVWIGMLVLDYLSILPDSKEARIYARRDLMNET